MVNLVQTLDAGTACKLPRYCIVSFPWSVCVSAVFYFCLGRLYSVVPLLCWPSMSYSCRGLADLIMLGAKITALFLLCSAESRDPSVETSIFLPMKLPIRLLFLFQVQSRIGD